MNEIPIHTVGRLVGDPELIHRRDGMAVAKFILEVVERRLTPDGWRPAGSTRLQCRAWAGLAQHIYDSLDSGDRVVVIGRLRQRPLNGGGHLFDVALDDVGISLVFKNVWPIETSDEGMAAGCSIRVIGPSESDPVGPGATI